MDEVEKSNTPAKGASWMWILLAALVVIVVVGGYFLMTKSSKEMNSQQSQQTNTDISPTNAPVDSATANTKQIMITGNEFAFSPSTLTVNKGDTVEITFKNTGKFPHNLSISDLSVKTKTIQSGEQDTISFVPDKTGSFQFTCTVPGHADKGMVGTLVVK